MNYATESVNCSLPTPIPAPGNHSRRPGVLKSNARVALCGQRSRRPRTFVPLRPEDREWEAFQEMLLASRPKFVRMAYAILRNKEDAEDAVQDALLSAYTHLPGFEGRSALTTWFGRIVLNASFMIRRKRKPSVIEFSQEPTTSEDNSWMEKIPTSQPDPEMCCAEGETLELVEVLLGKMSPMLRQAFKMTYFEEIPIKRAGAILGVTEGTFKSRLFRARQHLMNQVQRSLLAPMRRVTHPAYYRGRTEFQARRSNLTSGNRVLGTAPPVSLSCFRDAQCQ